LAATQGLGGGAGDDVGVGQGAGIDPGRDQAGDVGHVDQETGPRFLGNGGHAGEVDDPGIGRAACDQQLGPHFHGLGLDGVVVHQPALPVHRIMMRLEPTAGLIGFRAVA
jgi:hypothetical protein